MILIVGVVFVVVVVGARGSTLGKDVLLKVFEVDVGLTFLWKAWLHVLTHNAEAQGGVIVARCHIAQYFDLCHRCCCLASSLNHLLNQTIEFCSLRFGPRRWTQRWLMVSSIS